MRVLILCYSRTGNNRLLANHLAERIGADFEEVRTKGWRTFLSMILDMSRDRRPKIHPLKHDVAGYDHVLFLAPLWDMNIAHPMKTCLETVARNLGPYSFVTLCGYHRDGQPEHVAGELRALTGKEPAHLTELQVGDLVPEEDRGKVTVVSAKRVKPDELSAFEPQIGAILRWFAPDKVELRPTSSQRGKEVPGRPAY